MYLYKQEMYESFKFKFDGLKKVEQNFSQCFQDLFVLAVLNGKKKGTFLEVGGFHPFYLSNTALLEKQFEWKGISIDIDSGLAPVFATQRPLTSFIGADAVHIDYKKLLGNVDRVDYLSLDIEPSSQTLACLKKIVYDVKTRFSVITYETDVYDPLTTKSVSKKIRQESRDILQSLDYVLIAGNISNLTDDAPFEDWYIDKTVFQIERIIEFIRFDDTPLASHKYMLRIEE